MTFVSIWLRCYIFFISLSLSHTQLFFFRANIFHIFRLSLLSSCWKSHTVSFYVCIHQECPIGWWGLSKSKQRWMTTATSTTTTMASQPLNRSQVHNFVVVTLSLSTSQYHIVNIKVLLCICGYGDTFNKIVVWRKANIWTICTFYGGRLAFFSSLDSFLPFSIVAGAVVVLPLTAIPFFLFSFISGWFNTHEELAQEYYCVEWLPGNWK